MSNVCFWHLILSTFKTFFIDHHLYLHRLHVKHLSMVEANKATFSLYSKCVQLAILNAVLDCF